MTLSNTAFTYNGKEQKPTVTVKDGTTTLATSDYTVTYGSGRKNVGWRERKIAFFLPKGWIIEKIYRIFTRRKYQRKKQDKYA